MSSVIVTPAKITPVDLHQAKRSMQIAGVDDDGLIRQLLHAAGRHVEEWCNIALLTQTRRLSLDRFPPGVIRLDKPPLLGVTSITYLDTAGESQTLAAEKYSVDSDTKPARVQPVYGECWPSTLCQQNAVSITFTAGYGPAQTDVPADLQHAIILVAQGLYEGCEDERQLQTTVRSLLAPYAITECV